jgi:formylmethanofuran dehydrogenase subunit E
MRKALLLTLLLGALLGANGTAHLNSDDAFYERYVKHAPNAKPVLVRDTDSAMGRYNLYPKALDIKTLARAHGHLCDGLVLAYVELANILPKLFDDGIIDRTDLRVVAKNSPCLVDTSALMSGARINHGTLSLDNSLGGSFIVQRISTGEAYRVALADTGFLKALKAKEAAIKAKREKHEAITPADIDEVEALAFEAMQHMLYTDPEQLLTITKLKHYRFHFDIDAIGPRSDVVNKNVGR